MFLSIFSRQKYSDSHGDLGPIDINGIKLNIPPPMQELYDLDKYFFDNRGKLIFAKRIDGTEVRRLTAGNRGNRCFPASALPACGSCVHFADSRIPGFLKASMDGIDWLRRRSIGPVQLIKRSFTIRTRWFSGISSSVVGGMSSP
jgi:hypothetical protein